MTHAAPQLHKSSTLKALAIRRDPHWGAPIARGQHVGYRKLDNDRATWIARLRKSDGSMKFHSLGPATEDFTFDKAKIAASEWFATQQGGGSVRGWTVGDACREYVEALKGREKGAKSAKDAQAKFSRAVYESSMNGEPLATLTSAKLIDWRKNIGQTPVSQNRTMTSVRAALNYAVLLGRRGSELRELVKRVKQHKVERRYRYVYLDVQQRRAFLAHAADLGPAFVDFCLAFMLTGARPGEIARMKVEQFEPRLGFATFIGKLATVAPPRRVPLHPDAVKLFSRRAKGLVPGAFLFTRDDGSEWIPDNWDDLFKIVRSAAKLPPNTICYSLRHSYITQMLLDKASPLTVCKLTGTSLKELDEHYGHLVAKNAREDMLKASLV